MTSDKQVVVSESKGNNTWLGYVIAGITLGAAIGNMFMAGKIRNVMKMQIPNPEAWREGRTKPGAARESTESTSQQPHQPQRPRSGHPKISIVPDHIISHLSNLKLPFAPVSEAEIKSAYRKAVMQYHPDRMALKDIELKPMYEAKFRQSTDSYNALIDFYVKGKE